MKIQLAAPIEELTGYGEFARHLARGLTEAGADVLVSPIRIDQRQEKSLFSGKLGRHPKPDIDIVCMVPTLFGANRHPSARKNVGFSMWEADRLPNAWVEPCNKMDAVLVPSRFCDDVFRKSLKIPVKYAPPPLDFTDLTGKVRPEKVAGAPFVFYSIFQWSERKNPLGLIRAYWAAFTGRDDVVLRLKLYTRQQDVGEKARIEAELGGLRKAVRLLHYPRVELDFAPMTREQIIGFHLAGDCFVSATRGEGLGLGVIEAMALEIPVIATNCGGHKDFIQNGSYVVPAQETPCANAGSYAPWHTGEMWWAEPDLRELACGMEQHQRSEKSRMLGVENSANVVKRLYDSKTNSLALLSYFEELLRGK